MGRGRGTTAGNEEGPLWTLLPGWFLRAGAHAAATGPNPRPGWPPRSCRARERPRVLLSYWTDSVRVASWYSSCLFRPGRRSALPSGRGAAQAVPGGAVGSVFIHFQVPPASSAPGETMRSTEGEKLSPSQAPNLPQKRNTLQGLLSQGGLSPTTQQAQAQSIFAGAPLAAPP